MQRGPHSNPPHAAADFAQDAAASSPRGRVEPGGDISQLHTALLPPQHHSTVADAPTRQNLLVHEATARQWHHDALQCADHAQSEAAALAQAVARWRYLVDLPSRLGIEVRELAALNVAIPLRMQRVSQYLQRWGDAIAAARDHEMAAQRLRMELAQ